MTLGCLCSVPLDASQDLIFMSPHSLGDSEIVLVSHHEGRLNFLIAVWRSKEAA